MSRKEIEDRGLPTSRPCSILTLEVRDPRGSLLARHVQESRSYTRQYMRFLFGRFQGFTGPIGSTGVTGTSGGISWLSSSLQGDMVAGTMSGIVVGAGTQAAGAAGSDYRLGSFIRHGTLTTGNRLTYAKGTGIDETRAGGTVTHRFRRLFTNNAGSAVTVREAGWLVNNAYTVPGRYLIIRDLVGGAGLRVGTLSTLTVWYDLRTIR